MQIIRRREKNFRDIISAGSQSLTGKVNFIAVVDQSTCASSESERMSRTESAIVSSAFVA